MQTQTTAAPPAKGLRKFGLLDKLSYAAGDFGCNMSFAMKSMLTIYWTQLMGIDEILFAALLVVVQVWDGINDPILGTIVDADHHNDKRNKFLTYISAGSLGLTVVLFLASFGNGIGGCVMWAMVADALDYEEWKFGTRTEGTSYALYSLMRKIAQGVMPSLGLVAATFFGYEAVLGADQAPRRGCGHALPDAGFLCGRRPAEPGGLCRGVQPEQENHGPNDGRAGGPPGRGRGQLTAIPLFLPLHCKVCRTQRADAPCLRAGASAYTSGPQRGQNRRGARESAPGTKKG